MENYARLFWNWLEGVFTGTPRHPVVRLDRELFYIVAHRGSPTVHPENTLASFRHAVDVDGANALELDLCLTEDGEVVAWHDWDQDGTNARLRQAGLEPVVAYAPDPPEGGPLRSLVSKIRYSPMFEHYCYRAKEGTERFQECVPRFDEVVEWAAENPRLALLFLDIKVPPDQKEMVAPLLRRIEEIWRPRAEGIDVVLETGHEEIAREIARLAPDSARALDVEPMHGLVINPRRYSGLDRAIELGNVWASMARPRATTFAPWRTHRMIVERDARRARRRVRTGQRRPLFMSFTVDEERELEYLVRLGVNAIQTNRPALLRDICDRLGVTLARRGGPDPRQGEIVYSSPCTT